jgi:hypothetical protein
VFPPRACPRNPTRFFGNFPQSPINRVRGSPRACRRNAERFSAVHPGSRWHKHRGSRAAPLVTMRHKKPPWTHTPQTDYKPTV